jgi:hypothetical protein
MDAMSDLSTMTLAKWDRLTPAEQDKLRDLSGLIVELTGKEGERIEARYPAIDGFPGWSQRFYVGRSTGWRPCHQISQRNQIDGPPVYWPPGTTFRQLGKHIERG